MNTPFNFMRIYQKGKKHRLKRYKRVFNQCLSKNFRKRNKLRIRHHALCQDLAALVYRVNRNLEISQI